MGEDMAVKGDIFGRQEIERLVSRFYGMVREDTVLGPIFDEVARVDWSEHLPKIGDFWETVLFRTGGYKGSPLSVHRSLARHAQLDRSMFDRWLELFTKAVDQDFEGENAEHIKKVANDMAGVIHSRLHEIPLSVKDSMRYSQE